MKASKTKCRLTDPRLPPVQAMQELRLNFEEQYGKYLAWFYIYYPLSLIGYNIAKEAVDKIFKDDNNSS